MAVRWASISRINQKKKKGGKKRKRKIYIYKKTSTKHSHYQLTFYIFSYLLTQSLSKFVIWTFRSNEYALMGRSGEQQSFQLNLALQAIPWVIHAFQKGHNHFGYFFQTVCFHKESTSCDTDISVPSHIFLDFSLLTDDSILCKQRNWT